MNILKTIGHGWCMFDKGKGLLKKRDLSTWLF
jgi:hypothetical protein